MYVNQTYLILLYCRHILEFEPSRIPCTIYEILTKIYVLLKQYLINFNNFKTFCSNVMFVKTHTAYIFSGLDLRNLTL